MISILGGGCKFLHCVDNLTNFVTNVNMKKKIAKIAIFLGKDAPNF